MENENKTNDEIIQDTVDMIKNHLTGNTTTKSCDIPIPGLVLNQGWVCPLCHSVYAPNIPMCGNCSPVKPYKISYGDDFYATSSSSNAVKNQMEGFGLSANYSCSPSSKE